VFDLAFDEVLFVGTACGYHVDLCVSKGAHDSSGALRGLASASSLSGGDDPDLCVG
jgi:hypothetical protein